MENQINTIATMEITIATMEITIESMQKKSQCEEYMPLKEAFDDLGRYPSQFIDFEYIKKD